MIARVSGTLVHLSLNHCVIEAGHLGYKLFVTGRTIEALSHSVGQPVALWTHHAVREDAEDLYGFESREELDVFELLITVSGIGPRSALGVLNVADVSTIREAVVTGDASYLTKASGVGRKSAEKIILELKDKMGALDAASGGEAAALSRSGAGVAIDALVALGYAVQDAREAVKSVDRDLPLEAQIKEALRLLAR